ncbi:MAG: AMP-binding protein, partial [Thermoguttaceae bacterium]|nr:AMP-binding protein [Thermoguttaceae bacterium]
MNTNADRWLIPTRQFLRMCRRNMRRVKVADSTGMELTGAGLLMRATILRRLLRRGVLGADETTVGLLLPPSVAAVVANAALFLDCRVPVNLNYTVSNEVLNLCIARGKIRHVLTSRRVMERFENLRPAAELVYLEDLKEQVSLGDKLLAALQTWLLPVSLWERHLGLLNIRPDDLMTIIFTSGSTGDPKGVMLSHRNIGSNVECFDATLHLRRDDVLLGILPLFHSFGYTVTMWAALMLEPKVVYHVNPLDYHQVGALCRKHRGTLLVAAPTFLRSYVRRIPPEDFASLNLVITGAEKLPRELADAFEKRFGVRPHEGYGTTELSPVVSVNIPPSRSQNPGRVEAKEGTVGRPIVGVEAKVVDLETGRDLGPGRSGMLLIQG